MTDDEVIKEFVTVDRTPSAATINVTTIEWMGPHSPTSKAIKVATLAGEVSEQVVQDAIKTIAKDRKYFQRCRECGELNPVGWMHDAKICQGCASKNHGVVY